MLCSTILVLVLSTGALCAPTLYTSEDDLFGHQKQRLQPYYRPHYSPYFNDDRFDSKRLWMDVVTRELNNIDRLMRELSTRFDTYSSPAVYVSGTYKITIKLDGFDENNIKVKAQNGHLMVQAISSGDVKKIYTDVRNLPDDVNARGNWTYDGKELVITFPVKDSNDEKETKPEEESSETESTTSGIQDNDGEVSREEMDPNQKVDAVDADVGINYTNKHVDEIESNHFVTFSPIEQTTYAVAPKNDIKNDIEFVEIKY